MSAELVIDVNLCTGEYGASTSSGEPEWPPHPYRLFAALVAAAGPGRSPEETACLDALARLEAPFVEAAAICTPSTPYQVYVPSQKREMRGQRTARWSDRVVWPAHDRVRFRWPDAGELPFREVLVRLASRVAYLGRAKTLVILTVPERPGLMPDGTAVWVPAPGGRGEIRLRVSAAGMLADLDRDYEAGIRAAGRRPVPLRDYRRRDRLAASAEGVWGALGTWRLVGGSIPAVYALRVCQALRAAALACEGDSCPPEISGHDADPDGGAGQPLTRPHAAWLALPDAGYERSTGRVMGFGVAVPAGVRLPNMPQEFGIGARRFTIAAIDETRVPARGTRQTPLALTAWRWSRPSAVWASVTPVTLPWRGDRADRKAPERAVRAACVKAGFPRPVEVAVSDAPFLRGPALAHDYLRARQPGESARRACHALVRFDTEVSGPMLLGPFRYFGLGLMAPCDPSRAAR